MRARFRRRLLTDIRMAGTPAERKYLEDEFSFFEKITSISAILKVAVFFVLLSSSSSVCVCVCVCCVFDGFRAICLIFSSWFVVCALLSRSPAAAAIEGCAKAAYQRRAREDRSEARALPAHQPLLGGRLHRYNLGKAHAGVPLSLSLSLPPPLSLPVILECTYECVRVGVSV